MCYAGVKPQLIPCWLLSKPYHMHYQWRYKNKVYQQKEDQQERKNPPLVPHRWTLALQPCYIQRDTGWSTYSVTCKWSLVHILLHEVISKSTPICCQWFSYMGKQNELCDQQIEITSWRALLSRLRCCVVQVKYWR